jgi:hypothetical protein
MALRARRSDERCRRPIMINAMKASRWWIGYERWNTESSPICTRASGLSETGEELPRCPGPAAIQNSDLNLTQHWFEASILDSENREEL